MNRNQLIEDIRQQFQVESIGAVGLGLCWIVVDFHEDPIDSGGDSRAR